MYHPWRHFRSLTDWTLQWFKSEQVDGLTHFPSKTVLLDSRLLQVERRCTIAHELVHIERGPFPEHTTALEESLVEQIAARRLIDLDKLIDVACWTSDLHEAADLLWVTPDVLQTRIKHLHPSERAQLQQALDEKPEIP